MSRDASCDPDLYLDRLNDQHTAQRLNPLYFVDY